MIRTFFVTLALLLSPLFVFAQGGGFDTPGGGVDTAGGGVDNAYSLQNPLNVSSVPELLDRFFQAILIIVVPFAVLFIVYAGFRLILARGNPKELATAKRQLLYTLLGIAIVISASIIINILIDTACQVDIRGVSDC